LDTQVAPQRENHIRGDWPPPSIAQRHGGTITIIKNGPVAFMVTTTKAALNPENETRMLSLEIDDSAEQTTRVLNRVALNVGTNADKDAIDFHPWHFFQQ
jgi:hypothetical protein